MTADLLTTWEKRAQEIERNPNRSEADGAEMDTLRECAEEVRGLVEERDEARKRGAESERAAVRLEKAERAIAELARRDRRVEWPSERHDSPALALAAAFEAAEKRAEKAEQELEQVRARAGIWEESSRRWQTVAEKKIRQLAEVRAEVESFRNHQCGSAEKEKLFAILDSAPSLSRDCERGEKAADRCQKCDRAIGGPGLCSDCMPTIHCARHGKAFPCPDCTGNSLSTEPGDRERLGIGLVFEGQEDGSIAIQGQFFGCTFRRFQRVEIRQDEGMAVLDPIRSLAAGQGEGEQ